MTSFPVGQDVSNSRSLETNGTLSGHTSSGLRAWCDGIVH